MPAKSIAAPALRVTVPMARSVRSVPLEPLTIDTLPAVANVALPMVSVWEPAPFEEVSVSEPRA